MLTEPVTDRRPRRLDYFQLWVDSGDLSPVDIGPLNDALSEERPLAYIVEADPFTAQAILELDQFFFLNRVRGPGDDVSVALGHDALTLYCIKQEFLYRTNQSRDVDIKVPDYLDAI